MKPIQFTLRLLAYCSLCLICFSCGEDDENPVNNPPKIEAQTFSVQENSDNGDTVGTVEATDEDGDELTFAITAGNTGEAFAIGEASGVLTVADPAQLDFEASPVFTLTIQVNDGTVTATADVTINVTEAPLIQRENIPPQLENQSFDIDENSENGTVVGNIQASDDGDALTFSISAGNTGEAFEINPGTGELTVKTASMLDYETTTSFTLTIAVSDGEFSTTAEITINLNDIEPEPLATRAEVLAQLQTSYADLEEYLEFTYLFDAVYANTISSPAAEWNNLHGHVHNSGDEQVLKLWSDAYTLIFDLNNIILSAEDVLTDIQEKDEVTAQALAMRAYIYYELVKWFDGVPLKLEREDSELPRNTQQEVITQIQDNLNDAISILPVSWTAGEEGNVTKDFARTLLARTAVFNEDWSAALNNAEAIINSSEYTLSVSTTNFTADNPEVMWGFDQTGDAQFSDFFTKGNHVPVFRLTEAYLIAAEAEFALGFSADVKDFIDQLRSRAGNPGLATGLSQSELSEKIFEQWQSEMDLEGSSFLTLRRFFKAETELSIQDFQLLLPIPFEVIDNSQALTQNPGY